MAKKFFFIDDDESFLYLLDRICKKMENVSAVYTAINGKDALEKLKSWLKDGKDIPDVMFVDINMPVMDGFEFLDKFKLTREEFEELRKIIPIVMLTSSEQKSDHDKALATGIVKKCIIKPSGKEEIINILQEFAE